MTQTFGTDSNNDIYLDSSGNIAVLSGIGAVTGACETASKAQLGEMVLAIRQGIPNFQAVWVGVPNYKVWESYLRNILQNVEGVLEVTGLSISSKNSVLAYTANIRTQYGAAQING